jgi:hypothetical protein
MTDLVKRLRDSCHPKKDLSLNWPDKLLADAADRIERLEQLVFQYRNDLERPPAEDSKQRRFEAIDKAMFSSVNGLAKGGE